MALTFPVTRLVAAAILCSMLFWHPDCHALKFRPIRDGTVLLIYDCGTIGLDGETSDSCAPHERSFSGPTRYKNGTTYAGDADVLDRTLRSSTFSKIFLASGGGNLGEGVKVGEVLRRHNAYVVVPKGAKCVSACTVAFLGGRIRDVEMGGSYEVHAYSALLNASAEDLLKYANAEGEFAFDEFVKSRVQAGRVWAHRLTIYAQKMIGGVPQVNEIDELVGTSPDYREKYHASGAFRVDLERIRREGPSTAQEIMMRIERDTFSSTMNHFKANASKIGARGENAIGMLEIMFSSRITGTAALDENTLRERGYTNVRR